MVVSRELKRGHIVQIYSAYSIVIVMLIVTLIFATPIFQFLDEPPSVHTRRVNSLDGLRGFLALSVMIYHATIFYRFMKSGAWEQPPAPVFHDLGTVGVSLFFMITGFLFWGKLVASEGRPKWIPLYIGRVFRVGPLYILAIAVMALIVFARSDFEIRDTVSNIIHAITQWAVLGILGGPDFNGYKNVWIILAGVTWTLAYEWKFYAALLLIWPLATKRLHLPASVIGLLICLGMVLRHASAEWHFAALFLCGMVVASIKASGYRIRINQLFAGSAVAASVCAMLYYFAALPETATIVIMAVSFYLIAEGCSIFGLLNTKAAHRLGNISFCIYLLQGLIISMGLAIPRMTTFALSSPVHYWAFTCACAVALSLISAITFMCIERPGIRLGSMLIRKIRTSPLVQNASTSH